MRKTQIISCVLVVLAFLVSFYVYPMLPERVVSHWDINGVANGYMSRAFGAFFMPVLGLALLALFLVLPSLDPLKKNYESFRAEYDGFVAVLLGFFLYIHLLTLGYNLGYQLNIVQFLAPAFAVLFFYSGMLIQKAKQNWFVGIRTPWTLSSEVVWTKTHKIAGSMFKAAGVVALLGLVFPSVGLIAAVAVVFAAAVASVIYSYVEFQKQKKKK
ncbi:MAG: SdpI family protein [Candidatus ainarchaeum sp.]|nr:SdpI family protein [Candidatus ainarchaeum sp.]